mgnify:CR=1 FL=1
MKEGTGESSNARARFKDSACDWRAQQNLGVPRAGAFPVTQHLQNT